MEKYIIGLVFILEVVFFMKNIICSFGLCVTFLNAAYAEDVLDNHMDRYVYIGTEFGLSDPIKKSFRHEESNTRMRLKKSHMYGGRIGYSFYPNMMIEISGTYQPKYRMAYRLPEKLVAGVGVLPETSGITKVTSNVFTVNLIYEMQKMTSLSIKPYVIFGVGMAKILVKPNADIPYFKIKKNNQNCFAWQAGLGFSKDITDKLAIDFGAKMQVVNNIKVKYQTLNNTNSFDEATPIKKTIGVGEFTMGLTYKFPLR
jgi:opacity protein-like surface antigen